MRSHETGTVIEYQAIDALRNVGEVEQLWRQIATPLAGSFFLSWEWISTWLTTLPNEAKIELIVGRLGGKPVLAFFIGWRKVTRHGLFRYRTASLNSTADEYLDEISIECNGAVVAPDLALNVAIEICRATADRWDELYMPGLSDKLTIDIEQLSESCKNSHNIFLERDDLSHYVDLEKVRKSGLDYLSLLSPNRRQQIRRSLKEYDKQGGIALQLAENSEQALRMLDSLAELHQQEWNRRGKSGAFANSYFFDFHRALIQRHFAKGVIQLIRIYTPESTIGYLYNYVYNRDVLFYQCGFNYTNNNHARPGLISHYLSIVMNAKLNHNHYDFLAGDSQYKRSLATDHYRMTWVKLQRKTIRSWLENRSRELYNRIKKQH